ncbi:VOC family protein [Sphingomonas sp. PP-CC-3G-468]|uniref:VOC family protein n=1 Tax=Sphingomonas sp. PP-CC-3G-468 TaxID=2135656 RepID=UPI00104F92AD|nr:VOC family protein [Sphingomonas sp. PP-CC-3G-468]TCM00759.1 catechol 2,3-dioxygenase-like lactoylglutathione lyase family enzyme [Sphingomonas sp. PP-CC-3G-468]
MKARINGLNHVTLAFADVERSLAFYRDVLGCAVRAVWADGAYLEAGSLWLCLSRDENTRSSPHPDYSHIAFSVPDVDYVALSKRVTAEAIVWKENKSEGASTYFLDPDGHKLEIHLGLIGKGPAAFRHRGVTEFRAGAGSYATTGF